MDSKNYRWIGIDFKGIAPTPRCRHTMDFYEKQRLLIIYGGENQAMSIN